ncbi:hypothetical protein DM806_22070 [Sphingobium lactosutens]|uniref:molybdopterin dinucleotide binding domain-containing protein n=1 Tax=Sphingobium lactosutens TaxID=522773 RepID=UPI0015B9C9D3|nr:molybdopterin dinucleotide binding domain-containing protein [Sphingobium lactosutens]NWK98303.1 hypothetical protein [Sphingobium lactosutens]
MAGLIRIILDEGWNDREFCDRYVGAERMAALRMSVDPFTPERVEARAGLMQGQLRAIAEMFARDDRRGGAYAATGACMAPFSNLTQHLVEVINVICGRLRRAGDRLIVDLTSPERDVCEQVFPATRSWEQVPPSRIRGVGRLGGEKLTSTLAEEIMTPGEGQIRALFVNGANPASTVPDNARFTQALDALELLVVVDPYMTATAERAHYILPPRMQYERADLPLLIPNYPLQPENWLQFTPPVIGPPKGSDLTEDWYVYWSVAKRLGKTICFAGKELDMVTPPKAEALLGLRLKGARVSFDDLVQQPSGVLFEHRDWVVRPSVTEQQNAQFDVMPTDVAGELSAYGEQALRERDHPFLLTSRRVRDLFNTNGMHLKAIRSRNPVLPIFLNPQDMGALGLAEGDEVVIRSDHGEIVAIAQADDAMRPGVVAMSHSWGGLPGEQLVSGVNALISSVEHVETVNAMPRMSAIPVHIMRAAVARTAVAG